MFLSVVCFSVLCVSQFCLFLSVLCVPQYCVFFSVLCFSVLCLAHCVFLGVCVFLGAKLWLATDQVWRCGRRLKMVSFGCWILCLACLLALSVLCFDCCIFLSVVCFSVLCVSQCHVMAGD